MQRFIVCWADLQSLIVSEVQHARPGAPAPLEALSVEGVAGPSHCIQKTVWALGRYPILILPPFTIKQDVAPHCRNGL